MIQYVAKKWLEQYRYRAMGFTSQFLYGHDERFYRMAKFNELSLEKVNIL